MYHEHNDLQSKKTWDRKVVVVGSGHLNLPVGCSASVAKQEGACLLTTNSESRRGSYEFNKPEW